MAPSHAASAPSSGGFSCPCQRVPLSLSSATSAEYGDVASLARRMQKGDGVASVARSRASTSKRADGSGNSGTDSGGTSSVSPGLSSGGITPLHLAAQHGHPAAASLLLKEGGCHVDTGLPATAPSGGANDGKGASGATPLHRAAFSGAVSSMQILLSWGDDTGSSGGKSMANLLAADTSFGDQRTPLHKAVAGGRPLAVQLLLDTLRRRGLLSKALQMKDASGLTPIQLAQQFASLGADEMEMERQSVRRWDVVAGGSGADWGACLKLLEGAVTSVDLVTQQLELTAATSLDGVASMYCDEGDECIDGRCRTAVWESAFLSALSSSMEASLGTAKSATMITKAADDDDDACPPSPPEQSLAPTSIGNAATEAVSAAPSVAKTKMGRQCDACGCHSTALFRSANRQLVCRKCRRLGRRVG